MTGRGFEEMSRWQQQMGFPVQLETEQLDQLNKPTMRSVWRHVQAHVMPLNVVQTIRKNILLSKLKKMNEIPNHVKAFRVESMNEFLLAKNIADLQSKIDKVNNKISKMNEEMIQNNTSLVRKLNEKVPLKDKIRECKEKSRILELKHVQMQTEAKKLNQEVKKVQCYLSNRNNDSMKTSEQINEVSRDIYSKLVHLPMNVDGIAEVVLWLQQYPVFVSYGSIYNVIRFALRKLYNDISKLDVLAEYNKHVTCSLETKNVMSTKTHLNHLYSEIVNNELVLKESFENLKIELRALEGEKNNLKEKLVEVTNKADEVEQGVIDVLKNKEVEITLTGFHKLKEECTHFGFITGSCSENDKEQIESACDSYESAYLKLRNLIKYLREISCKELQIIKSEVLNNCVEMSTKFVKKNSCPSNEQLIFFNEYNYIMHEEIKLFIMTELDVILRDWDNRFSYCHSELDEILLHNLLYHSEPKNILMKVLEKIVWLYRYN